MKTFNEQTGYGFIKCDAISQAGSDVFLLRTELPPDGEVHSGQEVEFLLARSSRGQPQARDTLWLPFTPDAPEPAQASQPAPQPVHRSSQRYSGYVKSFGDEFGFIHCDEIHRMYSRDVFFPKTQVPAGKHVEVGVMVEFEVALNGRGQPQARNPVFGGPLEASFEKALVAVQQAQQAKRRGVLDSDWVEDLGDDIAPLASEYQELAGLLRNFGWSATQFRSPPNLDDLAAALREGRQSAPEGMEPRPPGLSKPRGGGGYSDRDRDRDRDREGGVSQGGAGEARRCVW